MADTATVERCLNCALLLVRSKDIVEPRTARVEELLRQNHPPLDIELSAFRKVAEDTRTALEDLDLKIVQAQELLENLLSARQQAQSHLEDAKSILHPTIPNEVLAEIFSGHCVLKAYSAEDPDTLDPKGGPWLLARVCRRWRELAVNTSQLWTHLFLDVDKHLGHITERQCAYKAGLFIQRSRGLPLDVYLGSAKSVADHPVLPVLEVSIPQWRYLYVDLQSASLQSLSGNSFLNLQWLKLIHDESDLHVDVFQPMRAPVLRAFEAAFSESWRDFEHVSLPWSHLTSVAHFPSAFAVEALNYLRTMADLEKLSILAVSETHTLIHDIVSLPKLRHLSIAEVGNSPGCIKEIFSSLAIPALLELILAFSPESVTHFPTSPLSLGNLTTLDVYCGMNSHEENTQSLLNFLTLTHHVESLCISDDAITLEFVDGLNLDKVAAGSPVRLPCLRFLDIGDCEFAPTVNDFVPFFEMLYSRLSAVTAEGKRGAEETVNDNVGLDGNGQPSAVTNETGMEFDTGSRLNSKDHRRCLKRVQIPHALYFQTRCDWPETVLELTLRVDLECGVSMSDKDY